MPEKNKRKVKRTISNCARSCFCQFANHPPFRLLSIKLKYPGCFTTFRFASFHFTLFLWKLNCFMWIYPNGKKLRGNVVFTTTSRRIYFAPLTLILYSMQIALHSADLTRDKLSPLISQMLAFLGTLFILTMASDFSFQSFNAGKLWEML